MAKIIAYKAMGSGTTLCIEAFRECLANSKPTSTRSMLTINPTMGSTSPWPKGCFSSGGDLETLMPKRIMAEVRISEKEWAASTTTAVL